MDITEQERLKWTCVDSLDEALGRIELLFHNWKHADDLLGQAMADTGWHPPIPVYSVDESKRPGEGRIKHTGFKRWQPPSPKDANNVHTSL